MPAQSPASDSNRPENARLKRIVARMRGWSRSIDAGRALARAWPYGKHRNNDPESQQPQE